MKDIIEILEENPYVDNYEVLEQIDYDSEELDTKDVILVFCDYAVKTELSDIIEDNTEWVMSYGECDLMTGKYEMAFEKE